MSTSSGRPPSRPEVRFTTLAEALSHGAEDMIARHAEEVPSGLPLDVDWPQYRKLERAGVYRVIGAFAKGRLVGYNAFFVQATLQHRSTVQAVNDVLYLEPEHRRGALGIRLITEAEPLLIGLGARRVAYASHPDLNRSSTTAKVAALLTRLGYDVVETAHAKLL